MDPMTRSEIVRWLVLNEICDDYENVDQIILPQLAEAGKEFGLAIERGEIVEALERLVADGMAKAFLLSGRHPYKKELAGMPSLEVVETFFETYFYITKKGMDAKLAVDRCYASGSSSS
jgi:hypothetical protein